MNSAQITFTGRVEASGALRGADFVCPACGAPVILRQGRKVVAHLAHRGAAASPADARGSRPCRSRRRRSADALRACGLRAEAEFATEQVAWDRRADVMVWSPGSRRTLAIEFQHSTIGVPEREARAQTYARASIAQLWVPFLLAEALARAKHTELGTRLVECYPVRLHELWMYGMASERAFWMLDAETETFWNAGFGDHGLISRDAIWYEMGPAKRYPRSGKRSSRRYRTLHLAGPWSAAELHLRTVARPAHRSEWFEWRAVNCKRAFIDVEVAGAEGRAWSMVPLEPGWERVIRGNSCPKGRVEDADEMRVVKDAMEEQRRVYPNLGEVVRETAFRCAVI